MNDETLKIQIDTANAKPGENKALLEALQMCLQFHMDTLTGAAGGLRYAKDNLDVTEIVVGAAQEQIEQIKDLMARMPSEFSPENVARINEMLVGLQEQTSAGLAPPTIN